MEGGSTLYQYLATWSVNIATITIGTIFTWTSPTFPQLSGDNWENTSPLSLPLTRTQESWIGSLPNIGAIFGPILAYFFVDRVGRKNILLASAVPFIFSWILIATTQTVFQLYVARILAGFSVGAVFSTLPVYVGEISEKKIRGRLGTCLQLFLTFGLMFSFAIGPFVTFELLAVLSGCIPATFFLLFILMPETPYYYIKHGDINAATKSLTKLRGRSKSAVEIELFEIKSYMESTKQQQGSIKDLFVKREVRKSMFITCGLMAFQQLCCMNAVLMYTQEIFAAAGGNLPAEYNSIIIGFIQILASCLTPFIVDRLGRRALLQISGIGMGVGLLFLGLFFYMVDLNMDVHPVQFLPVLSLIVYVSSFCVGFGSLPWVVVSELFPSNVKSIASTVIASFCWTVGFIITLIFPRLLDSMGMSKAFWLFSIVCFLSTVFVSLTLPETKGKSLQEIQDFLKEGSKKKLVNSEKDDKF